MAHRASADGERPCLTLLSQLTGERARIANVTGCFATYRGNLPVMPWSANREGRGPAWSNSLFEDDAKFGLGLALAVDSTSSRHALCCCE